jgi:hypothetical protein
VIAVGTQRCGTVTVALGSAFDGQTWHIVAGAGGGTGRAATYSGPASSRTGVQSIVVGGDGGFSTASANGATGHDLPALFSAGLGATGATPGIASNAKLGSSENRPKEKTRHP